MKSTHSYVFCAALCVVVPLLISADCEIKDPNRCDLAHPNVVKSIKFNGSCVDDVAKMFIGDTYKLAISFRPVEDATNATTKVMVEVFGLCIPVKLDDTDACVDKGLHCPLKADTDYTYTAVFPLDTKYPCSPSLHVIIKWYLIDKPADENGIDGGHDIFCVKIPVTVQPSPSCLSLPEDTAGSPSFKVIQ